MKHKSSVLLQIIVVALLTGGTAHAMQPPAAQPPQVKAVVVRKVDVPKPKVNEPPKAVDVPVVEPPPPAAPEPVSGPAPEPPPAPAPVALSKTELMAAAGIAASDYEAVDYIVSHESSWNPDATNAQTGAHGLIQALPYSKTGCDWSDAVCQLKWAHSYATSRYGSWTGAQYFWLTNKWW